MLEIDMKVHVLGANSAFKTGKSEKALSYDKVYSLFQTYYKMVAEKKKLIPIKTFLQEKGQFEHYYKPSWQSNFILEFENDDGKRDDGVYRLAFDFGADFRHSLKCAGRKLTDIDGYYVSHPHHDHIGGVEYIALSTLFDPSFTKGKSEWLKENGKNIPISQKISDRENEPIENRIPKEMKPDLYGHKEVLRDLWMAARPGLNTIQGVLSGDLKLDLFFNVMSIKPDIPIIMNDGLRQWKLYIVPSSHVLAGYGKFMPSYGLLLKCSDGKQIFMPSDTQFMNPKTIRQFYETSDYVYQDCETGSRSDVHPYIEELRFDPAMTGEIKQKCFLYHYDTDPEVDDGEFAGTLKAGDCHSY